MSKDKNVRFIRKNGRLIPIRTKKKGDKKDKAKAVAKGAASATVLAASAKKSASLVDKSRKNFSEAAKLRGLSKLAGKGSKTRGKFIRKSAQQKIKGLKFQGKARFILSIGTAASSILASSAAGDIFKGDDRSDEFAGFASAAVPFIGTFAFKKFGKVGFGGKNPSDVFRNIQRFGEKQSRSVSESISRSALNPSRKRKGGQIEMDFGQSGNKMTKFLKGF